ncbi:MAG: NAD-dependent epimerase/dehydratase family protein [Verrucomicrobiia bacterium]|jgi:UDP-glucose 4-epimerase
MTTVAVFGATGKLGRRLLPSLADRGMACRALIHTTPLDCANALSIQGSITEPEAVNEVVNGADVVIQMATTKEDADTFFDVSVKGTFNVLESCRQHKIRQFILLGGDASFGIWFYPQPVPIDEGHALAAYPGYYAFSKVMEETMTEQYRIQYGLPTTILRSSWVHEDDDLLNHLSLLKNVDPAEKGHGFGEVDEETLALVRAGEERIPILIDRDGNPFRRHIVHIDDVMQALHKVIDEPAAIGTSFNIAGPAAFDYCEAANYLSERTGIPTQEIRSPEYHSFEIAIGKARRELDYAPENDIFGMIDRALEFRANPQS